MTHAFSTIEILHAPIDTVWAKLKRLVEADAGPTVDRSRRRAYRLLVEATVLSGERPTDLSTQTPLPGSVS